MSQITIWSFHLHYVIISRRSRQRERLSASVLSICSSVCLFACLSVCLSAKKRDFLKTKQFRAMVSVDDLYEIM